MTRIFVLTLLMCGAAFFVSCTSTSTPKPPKKKSLSTQPHNRPASWEGTGGLGGMMGPQYQD